MEPVMRAGEGQKIGTSGRELEAGHAVGGTEEGPPVPIEKRLCSLYPGYIENVLKEGRKEGRKRIT